MRNLFYFLIGFFAAGVLCIATAKADEQEIAFRSGCQQALSSIGLDTNYEWLKDHCNHLISVKRVETNRYNWAQEQLIIKAIKDYNAKPKPFKLKELNDAIKFKETNRIKA